MSTTQFAPQLRPLSVGEQLDASFKVVRQSFGTLALCVLVVALPLNILNTLILASTRDNPFDLNNSTSQVSSGTAVAGQLLTSLLSIVLTAIAAAACFRAVSSVYLGEKPTVEGSLRFAASRALSVIWLSILYFVGLIIPFIALVIPGVWLAVAWSVSYPALLAEGLGGASALGRSFRLVRGRWWPTFGALLVMYLIVLVISGILGLLFGATLIASLDNEPVAAVLTTIVNTLSSLITLPLFAAVLTIIYYDLRVRKEGFDLHLLAQTVGGEGPTSPENVAAASGLGGFAPPQASEHGGFAPPQPPSQAPPGYGPPAPEQAPGDGAPPEDTPAGQTPPQQTPAEGAPPEGAPPEGASPGEASAPDSPDEPPRSGPGGPAPDSGLSSGDPLGPPPERREGDGGASS